MPTGRNKTDNKSDDQLLIMQATIEANRQYYHEKMNHLTEDLTVMTTSKMDHITASKSLPEKMDSPKAQDPTTVVPANKRVPPLEVP